MIFIMKYFYPKIFFLIKITDVASTIMATIIYNN